VGAVIERLPLRISGGLAVEDTLLRKRGGINMKARHSTLVLLFVATAIALVASPAASARTQEVVKKADMTTYTYGDATGDSKSAPDVASVIATLDSGSGVLGLGVVFANNDDLSNGGILLVAIDADRNPSTGNQVGAEYMLAVTQNGYLFQKWDGKQMSSFSHQPVVVTTTAGGVIIALSTSDLGTQSFNFVVASGRGNDLDIAPDNGEFSLPPSTTTTSQIKFDSILVGTKPTKPKAGKQFSVNVGGAKLDTGEIVTVDSYSCTATVAGHALHGSGTGGCSWKLPKKAKSKKLVVDVTVSYQGVSDTFEATYKIH
jgi:hypothetical protein